MRAKRSLFLLTACLGLPLAPAKAEFIGLNIGASQWAPAVTGSFNSGNDGSIELVDDLDVDDPSQTSMVLILEHPIRVLPNVKYQGFDLDSSGTSTLSTNIDFNGETFTSGNEVTSNLDLSHDDIVFYYQLAAKRFDLNLGVDLKRFDGQVSLSGESTTSVDVEETIPLLYLSARYDLPNSGFFVGANINANFVDLGLTDSDAQESTIMMGYETTDGLGISGGFKSFSLELDDVNTLDTDLEYDGLFLNGYINF